MSADERRILAAFADGGSIGAAVRRTELGRDHVAETVAAAAGFSRQIAQELVAAYDDACKS